MNKRRGKSFIVLGIGMLVMQALPQSALSARLVDNGDATVSDLDTGLMWQQQEGGLRPWLDFTGITGAKNYCESLSLAGKSDWRLPNPKELSSIVDYRLRSDGPVFDETKFPDITSSTLYSYWTVSSKAGDTGYAWIVNADGSIDIWSKTNGSNTRCVR